MPAAFPDHPRVLTVSRGVEAEHAKMRAARAARLALLRPAAAQAPEPPLTLDAGAPEAALGAIVEPALVPASILHFLRPTILAPEPAPPAAPVCDLDRIQGLGPDLIWALGRAGVTRCADLAECATADLAARLGAIGRLAPVAAWIAQARATMGTDA